ncbi:tetratricopeptide repeat protein [Leadbettera azotonutricia]|uniref:Tetratricopeptide repeat domain protein n=1 Tax=Leadbettera azotonutricia (strain ATCC BAA-888 / DSM 13862 / ZAS-9) TaxID=545695 RepID=F5YE48_LEAAZ|nr:tetratricopeptide repeat protein [Leadbettera azotonutricia]AEF81644.1 tetratricopeptide repeat domain protein [Leadbettera azotonutricia ZAS-9]
MKKCVSLSAFLLVLIASAFSQSADSSSPLRTSHYEISIEEGAESAAQSLSTELELRFDVYNRLFRFSPAALAVPLKVRVFVDKNAYDSYVTARVGQSRPGAVYLHYNQSERRELLVCKGASEEASMLGHQAFTQFLRGFIANPPAWIREGFAIYFSGLKFDPAASALTYEENLAYLEPVKNLGKNAPGLQALMQADSGNVPPNFQICSWALVSFFLNNGKEDYFRTLVESFLLLSPTATASDNSQIVINRVGLWIAPDAMAGDYQSYLNGRRTFAELMEDGRKAYTAHDSMTAELCFLSALDQRSTHYAPYYYLGLIYYEEKNYDMADEFYQSSLKYGADEALVSYALGVNAVSAGRNADAIAWLQRAASVDPNRYKARAEELINRLK